MRKKRFLAGVLTAAMVSASLALPGNTLQAEAASKAVKKITIAKKSNRLCRNTKEAQGNQSPKGSFGKNYLEEL